VLARSSSSAVLFLFNKSNRRAVNPGRYGENGELRCVGMFSAKSFSISGILVSSALPSGFGGADPTSTTSFHLGVGISYEPMNEINCRVERGKEKTIH